MSDILSTEEISALLDAFCQNNTSKDTFSDKSKQIRSYDFAAPERFSAKQIKGLQDIHTRFAAVTSVTLTDQLHTNIKLDFAGLELISFKEYLEIAGCNSVYAVSASGVVFEMNSAISCAFIDALTGGISLVSTVPYELTDIDKAILHKVQDSIINKYLAIWTPHKLFETPCRLIKNFESLTRFMAQNRSVVVISFDVNAGPVKGRLRIALDTNLFDKIIPVSAKNCSNAPINTEHGLEIAESIAEPVGELPISFTAVLGHTDLSLTDIANLQQGDVIKLDTRILSEIELWMRNKHVYSGTIGKSKKGIGVKITGGAKR